MLINKKVVSVLLAGVMVMGTSCSGLGTGTTSATTYTPTTTPTSALKVNVATSQEYQEMLQLAHLFINNNLTLSDPATQLEKGEFIRAIVGDENFYPLIDFEKDENQYDIFIPAIEGIITKYLLDDGIDPNFAFAAGDDYNKENGRLEIFDKYDPYKEILDGEILKVEENATTAIITFGVYNQNTKEMFKEYTMTFIKDENSWKIASFTNVTHPILDTVQLGRDGFTVDRENTLTKYTGGSAVVDIPNGVLTLDNSFSWNTNITTVVIPESVTKIGDNVFFGCENISQIAITQSVTAIGANTFANSGLTSVVIPASVKTIGEQAFATYPVDVTSTVNGETVSEKLDVVSKLETVVIEDGVVTIGDRAFAGAGALTSITIPPSIKSFGEDIFADCPLLTTIAVKEGSRAEGYAEENGYIVEHY